MSGWMCVCLGFRCLKGKDVEVPEAGVDQDLLTGEKKEDDGTKHRAGESAKLKAGLLKLSKTERVTIPSVLCHENWQCRSPHG